MSRPKDLLCPACGHVDGPPFAADDACPACTDARLGYIDPEIIQALTPFAPTDAEMAKKIGLILLGAAVIGAVNLRSIRKS